MRDRTIDVCRGLLVLAMIYCHTLQFFGDTMIFPGTQVWIDVINQLAFPGFVFCFGYTAALAYLSKPYQQALPGMARTALRALFAFYVSGIAFRVLRENKPLAPATVRGVLTLADIPGWSEFLISFALYALLILLGFRLFQLLSAHPLAALVVCALCVLCCFLPYDAVASVQLGLFIGGRQFSYFPVVQCLPYLLAGMVVARGSRRVRLGVLAVALLCTLAGAIHSPLTGPLPDRFPPEWAWVLRPAAGVALIVLLAWALCRAVKLRYGYLADRLCAVLGHFGGKSLYYLLASNLALFALAGRNIVPKLDVKSTLPWTLPIQSPSGALAWASLLVCGAWFLATLAQRGSPRSK